MRFTLAALSITVERVSHHKYRWYVQYRNPKSPILKSGYERTSNAAEKVAWEALFELRNLRDYFQQVIGRCAVDNEPIYGGEGSSVGPAGCYCEWHKKESQEAHERWCKEHA